MSEEIENKMTVKYCFYLDTVTSEKIRRKCYYTTASTYLILNYDKNYMSFDDAYTGSYRSIVFSYPDKNVVCFSPPKSIPTTMFMSKYPRPDQSIWINEAIEGVSINLFYDKNIKKWMIATKSSIGGNYWFYGKKSKSNIKQPTFLDMFIEALKGQPEDELNDLVILQYLPKEYCYNFVLQHQDNNIILPVKNNSLYLIGVYKINVIEVEYIPQVEYESWNVFNDLIGIINFPQHYIVPDYEELGQSELAKGYMLTNMESGERTMIKNKRYDDLKMILNIL